MSWDLFNANKKEDMGFSQEEPAQSEFTPRAAEPETPLGQDGAESESAESLYQETEEAAESENTESGTDGNFEGESGMEAKGETENEGAEEAPKEEPLPPLPQEKKKASGAKLFTPFRELTRKEIFAMSPKEADEYWKSYTKWMTEIAKAKILKEKKAYQERLEKQLEKERKRRNHIKFVLAEYAFSNEPEMVSRFFAWAEGQDFTQTERETIRGMKEEFESGTDDEMQDFQLSNAGN